MITIKKHVMLAIRIYYSGEQDQNYGNVPQINHGMCWFNYGITKPQFEKMLERTKVVWGLSKKALPDNSFVLYRSLSYTGKC